MHASSYSTVSHRRSSRDDRPSFDSDSCMMLNEGIGRGSGETPARMVWRKLNVIGGAAFASGGAADEILIMVGAQLIW